MKFLLSIFLLITLSSCSYKLTQHSTSIQQITKNRINMYLVKSGNNFVMIDCGTPNEGKKIEAFLTKNNISPKNISYLILTHGHYDHAGNAAYFQKKFGTQIIASKGDLEMINHNGVDNHACPRGFLGWMGRNSTTKYVYPTFTPDILITEETQLNIASTLISILPLSGHTEGSLVIKFEDNIFAGDLIRGNFIFPKIPKRHVFMCDLEDNNNDLKQVLELDNTKNWYLGHSGPLKSEQIIKFLKKKTKP